MAGLAYRGIGLEMVSDDQAGAWFDDWDVTHIGSGRRIGTITGLDEAEALKLATVIAELTDWSVHDDPENIIKEAPDLMTKLLVLADLAGGSLIVRGSGSPLPKVVRAASQN